jgi:hypothetical protein
VGNIAFNRSKGREVEFAERIIANDPANSAFILEIVNTSETDANLQDLDDFAAIEANASTAEVTNTNYARKTLDQTVVTRTYDDTNNRVEVFFPDQSWTAVASGTAWTDAIVGYDPDTTGGADSAVLPVTLHDFVVTPDGSDITLDVPTTGFVWAT